MAQFVLSFLAILSTRATYHLYHLYNTAHKTLICHMTHLTYYSLETNIADVTRDGHDIKTWSFTPLLN